ncbi:MAG: carboxypeptidase-like regulatory domain-containing protein, partial [Tepidisphaeraceae bacterium]
SGKTASVVVKLHRGQSITGTVTDNAGKPIAGAVFTISILKNKDGSWNPNETQLSFTSDAQGHFTVSGLPVGIGTLSLYIANPCDCDWQQPAPLDIEVPAQGPIAVTLTPTVWHTLHGRVVDAMHHPLAGVTVTVSVSLQNVRQQLTAVTGKDGGYQLAKIPAGCRLTLLSLRKAGYSRCGTGSLTHAGSETIDDAMMAANATVRGKVCDAGGKPVPGATVVSAEGGLSLRTVTDAAGAFTLPEQPGGELHLVAATAAGGGLVTCPMSTDGKARSDIRITFTPGLVSKPHDIALALSLLDADGKRPADKRRFDRAATIRLIADLDIAQAMRLARAGNEPVAADLRAYLLARQAEQDPSKIDALLLQPIAEGVPAYLLAGKAKKDPSKVDEILNQLNMLKNSDCKLYAAVEIGIAVVKNDPELAAQLYRIAKPLYDKLAHGSDAQKDIDGLGSFDDISLRTLTLAALLQKSADVDAMLAQLCALAKPPEDRFIIPPLAEAAGRVSPEFVFQVCDRLDAQDQSPYLGLAVSELARHDAAAAARLLQMIEAKNDSVPPNMVVLLINSLGKTDAASALALAKAQPDNLRSAALLAAAAFQPREVARTLLQDMFSQEAKPTFEDVVKVNAIDPELGKALYTKYLQPQQPKSDTNDLRELTDCARYAFEISSLDPLEARLLIETAYARAKSLPAEERAESVPEENRMNFLSNFRAIFPLDLNRAMAVFDALDNKNGNDLQGIMKYILMSREERVDTIEHGFDR